MCIVWTVALRVKEVVYDLARRSTEVRRILARLGSEVHNLLWRVVERTHTVLRQIVEVMTCSYQRESEMRHLSALSGYPVQFVQLLMIFCFGVGLSGVATMNGGRKGQLFIPVMLLLEVVRRWQESLLDEFRRCNIGMTGRCIMRKYIARCG